MTFYIQLYFQIPRHLQIIENVWEKLKNNPNLQPIDEEIEEMLGIEDKMYLIFKNLERNTQDIHELTKEEIQDIKDEFLDMQTIAKKIEELIVPNPRMSEEDNLAAGELQRNAKSIAEKSELLIKSLPEPSI